MATAREVDDCRVPRLGRNIQELVDLGHDDKCPVQVDRGASAGRHISADPGVVPAEATPTTAVPHAQGRASESRPKDLGRSSRLRKTRIDPPTRELGGSPGATKHGRNHQMFGAIAQIPGGDFRD